MTDAFVSLNKQLNAPDTCFKFFTMINVDVPAQYGLLLFIYVNDGIE